MAGIKDAFSLHLDWDDDDLGWSNAWRENQTIVITVDHDDGAKKSRGNAPRGLVWGLKFVLSSEVMNSISLSKSLS